MSAEEFCRDCLADCAEYVHADDYCAECEEWLCAACLLVHVDECGAPCDGCRRRSTETDEHSCVREEL